MQRRDSLSVSVSSLSRSYCTRRPKKRRNRAVLELPVLRHFISQTDLTPSEVRAIFLRTERMKPVRSSGELRDRSLVMLFEKSSTRTRLSFEIGMTQLG